MKDQQEQPDGRSLGVTPTLVLLLAALKLFGVIEWPWWLITLPAWGWFVFIALVFIGADIRWPLGR